MPKASKQKVLWGLVSDEVDARLAAGTTLPARVRRTRLCPHDWKSGDKAWVVEVIAPGACPGPRAGGGGDAMVADLKAQVFKDRELRALVVKDGRREVRVV